MDSIKQKYQSVREEGVRNKFNSVRGEGIRNKAVSSPWPVLLQNIPLYAPSPLTRLPPSPPLAQLTSRLPLKKSPA